MKKQPAAVKKEGKQDDKKAKVRGCSCGAPAGPAGPRRLQVPPPRQLLQGPPALGGLGLRLAGAAACASAPPSRPVQHRLRFALQRRAPRPRPRPLRGPRSTQPPHSTQPQPGAQVKAEGDDKKPAKVKKEFDLPGQTRETPPEVRGGAGARDSPARPPAGWAAPAAAGGADGRRGLEPWASAPDAAAVAAAAPARPAPQTDPMRKFYTSLLEQTAESEMARRWCAAAAAARRVPHSASLPGAPARTAAPQPGLLHAGAGARAPRGGGALRAASCGERGAPGARPARLLRRRPVCRCCQHGLLSREDAEEFVKSKKGSAALAAK